MSKPDKPKKWAIRMQDGGPMTLYAKRDQARAAAKHRSRFDDCAYCIFKRNEQGGWDHTETRDFHKHVREALKRATT